MELVESTFVLSDFTKKTLAQFGWNEGDAIPAELGPMLVSVRESLPPSPRADVLIDIDLMPADAIAKAKEMLAAAKEAGRKKTEQDEKERATAHLNPAARMLHQAASALPDAPEIIDDRNDLPAKSPPEQTPPPQAENPAAAAVEAPETLGPMAILPFCPRCGWDMRQKYEIVPTDLDKEDFVSSILGNVRFKRDYQILGGKVVFTFHTILAEQNKMIHRQLVVDQNDGLIKTEAEWFVQMFEYRLALSLETVQDGNGKLLHAVPELSEMSAADSPPLVALKNHVNNTALAHEITRRLAGQHLRQFQRLVEALEAMALEPSFWNGIEQQP